jgi:hypothetical protein
MIQSKQTEQLDALLAVTDTALQKAETEGGTAREMEIFGWSAFCKDPKDCPNS